MRSAATKIARTDEEFCEGSVMTTHQQLCFIIADGEHERFVRVNAHDAQGPGREIDLGG